MSNRQNLFSFGNPRIEAAANRLNSAFLKLENKLESSTPTNATDSENPEIDLLEDENMRLHKEVAGLRELLVELDEGLEKAELTVSKWLQEGENE